MSEFFLSTDFGILLCVFFFGVGISGRLAAWGRAFVARVNWFRKNLTRYRVKELELRLDEFEKKVNAMNDLAQCAIDQHCGPADLEDRIKIIEDWFTGGVNMMEAKDLIKKKAKERTEAVKKLN